MVALAERLRLGNGPRRQLGAIMGRPPLSQRLRPLIGRRGFGWSHRERNTVDRSALNRSALTLNTLTLGTLNLNTLDLNTLWGHLHLLNHLVRNVCHFLLLTLCRFSHWPSLAG